MMPAFAPHPLGTSSVCFEVGQVELASAASGGDDTINGSISFSVVGNAKLGRTGPATQVNATVNYSNLTVARADATYTLNSTVTMNSSSYEATRLETIQYIILGVSGLSGAEWGTIKGSDGTDLQYKASGVKLERGCEDTPIGGTINVKGRDSGGNDVAADISFSPTCSGNADYKITLESVTVNGSYKFKR